DARGSLLWGYVSASTFRLTVMRANVIQKRPGTPICHSEQAKARSAVAQRRTPFALARGVLRRATLAQDDKLIPHVDSSDSASISASERIPNVCGEPASGLI